MDRSPSSFLDSDLRSFFRSRLDDAATNQRVQISPIALQYVTDLLVSFHETARLFVQQGVKIPVLADMLNEALEADLYRRMTILRQMGDTSLMVSGYFPCAVRRRSVDLDYYKRMGEIAYLHLDSLSNDDSIFEELSERFLSLSELINEVSEETQLQNASVLEVIDYYMKSGSDRLFEKLKAQGIIPLKRPAKKGGA